jgi:3-oxoacyl-[acyl-carrier protein] reductase
MINFDFLKDSMSLDGKVAIVTGASRPHGQGKQVALLLAMRGARVVVTDVDKPDPAMVFDELGIGSASLLAAAVRDIQERGGEAIGVAVDVTRKEQIASCVRKTVETFGGIDILVNNAGNFNGVKPLLDTTDSDWNWGFQVHIKGVANFCAAVIPEMKKRGGGCIVNNVSVAGIAAFAGMSSYVATKHGTVGLTKALADEFGPDNIRVNAVCPGNVWTDISQAEAEDLARRDGSSAAAKIKWMEEMSPFGRYGTAREIAEVMVFLCSPAASFMHGAIVRVDGGMKGLLH